MQFVLTVSFLFAVAVQVAGTGPEINKPNETMITILTVFTVVTVLYLLIGNIVVALKHR